MLPSPGRLPGPVIVMAASRADPPDGEPGTGAAPGPQPGRKAGPGPSAFRYGRPAGRAYDAEPGHSGGNAGWSLFGYLISGMAVYGGLGWLIGHWTGLSFLFPAGLFLGLAAAILLIVLKYGRP